MDALSQPRLTAEERKQRDRLAARRRWEKFEAANPEHLRAYRKQWAALHPEKEREYDRRQRAKMKADPLRLALFKARQERYREKRNAHLRKRYRDDPGFAEQARARQRRYQQKIYAATSYQPIERGQAVGRRRCTVCGRRGHNRRSCELGAPVASHCHDSVNTLTGGGGGALPVEYGTPPPAAVGAPPRHYLDGRHGGAGPARVAELRDQIARGVYVPFAALRAEFAGVAPVPSEPSEWSRERNRRRNGLRTAEATP